jgi:hypothetical protein
MTEVARTRRAGSVAEVARRADLAQAVDHFRSSLLAGGIAGLIIGGVGGRLAMLLLRVTSPETVRGLESDDGFVIGRITLFGTVSLLAFGTAIGIIGAFGYRAVAPSLIGPSWLQRLTAALGAGAVVGAILVHADGIDFTLLEPTWLAIALFVAIPVAFGAVIGPALDRCSRQDAWVNRGKWRRWLLPLAFVAFLPILLPFLVIIAAALVLWALLDQFPAVHALRSSPVALNLLRAAWLGIAILGLWALTNDVVEIA